MAGSLVPDWLETADRGAPWEALTICVAGLGVSGFAAADALLRLGSSVVVVDSREGGLVAQRAQVLELLGSRYADPASATWPEMLADSIQNQGLYIGPAIRGNLGGELEAFRVTVNGPSGVIVAHDGRHGDGHPLRPLHWLANFLATRNQGLRAGQIVTTGSYAGALDVPLGQPLSVTFGDLGIIEIELERAA